MEICPPKKQHSEQPTTATAKEGSVVIDWASIRIPGSLKAYIAHIAYIAYIAIANCITVINLKPGKRHVHGKQVNPHLNLW